MIVVFLIVDSIPLCIPGNEAVNTLVKEGGTLPQTDTSMACEEAKSMIERTFSNKWAK